MLRIQLTLPRHHPARYRFLDLVHDAIINAWTKAGAAPEQLIGSQAAPWTFAPIGDHRQDHNRLHSLVIATPDPQLSTSLSRLDPANVCKLRPSTQEQIDLSAAHKQLQPDPILPNQQRLATLLLSPLAIRRHDRKGWHQDLRQIDLSAAVNARLSRLGGRPVKLIITPDSLYLRANPRHSVLIPTKGFGNGKISFVIALAAPLLLEGSDEDLRLAWYSGIGEKNRNGFGCLGQIEQGVGQ